MPPSVPSNPERQAPTEIQPPSLLDLVTASSVSRDESPHLTSMGRALCQPEQISAHNFKKMH